MRKFLIVFVAAGLAKNLPLYGAYPPVKDLLMHLTGTDRDEKNGKLLCRRTLDNVFKSAFDKTARKRGVLEFFGEAAASRVALNESSSFKVDYRIGDAFRNFSTRSEWKFSTRNECMEILSLMDLNLRKIYKVLLSEDFARGLLTDAFVDALCGSGLHCAVSVKDKGVNDGENSGTLRDFYVGYSQDCGGTYADAQFKFTCDIQSGEIKDGSVCVNRMKIIDIIKSNDWGTVCSEYRLPDGMGHCDLLDELRGIIDKEEEAVLEKKSEGTSKRRELRVTAQEKLPFDSEESLKDTFSKYPTPEILLRDLKCSNKDWDDSFRSVSQWFRELEASGDEKSQYAESKILFKLQGKKVLINAKGIPDVPDEDIPLVEKKPCEFKQVCKVLLSVDFAEELLGDFFIRSFLKKDEGYESLIAVSFDRSVGGENVFDFCITYCQKKKDAQSCRVHIKFNVHYDADEGRFKRDEKGRKVQIAHFCIGKFGILPLNPGEILRSDDLKYLSDFLSKRRKNIEERLFSSKGKLFVSIVDEGLSGGWVGIRRSVMDVCPYQDWSGVRLSGQVFEDHDPTKPQGGCSSVCLCKCASSVFKFMYERGWVSVKDWLTGGEVVLCKNGGLPWYGKQQMKILDYVTRYYWQEKINPEKILIDRERLMKLKNWKEVGLEKQDWPLLKSSVFMVGEAQSEKKLKESRQKREIFKKFSGNDTIREEAEEEEEEEGE